MYASNEARSEVTLPLTSDVVLRLEGFLNDVLKQSLDKILTERDGIHTRIAQCTQLRGLFGEMSALSRDDMPAVKRTAAQAKEVEQHNHEEAEDAAQVGSSSSTTSLHTSSLPKQRNTILVNLGNHFYTPATIADATRVHVNIGCGVVLSMTTYDAEVFLTKKERVLRRIAMNKSKEALRIRYRIRLVTETIARLHDRHVGLSQ